MKNYYYCSECDNTVEFGHDCPSYITPMDRGKVFNTWLKEQPNAPEADDITELRRRVATILPILQHFVDTGELPDD